MIFEGDGRKQLRYISWLNDIIGNRWKSGQVRMLTLLDIDYEPEYGNDENRAIDGIALRRRFESQKGYLKVADEPCSYLEMMIALAERAVDLMADDENERDVGFYFDLMIKNLGINRVRTPEGIRRCVAENEPFVAKNPPEGWETMEIWKKMNWVLTEMWYEDGDDEW